MYREMSGGGFRRTLQPLVPQLRTPHPTINNSSVDRSHESPFVFGEAFCSFVMKSCGVTLWIVFDFATISVIGVNTLEAEQRHRDVVRAGFADAGKTERRRRRRVSGHEVAVVRAAIFFDKP